MCNHLGLQLSKVRITDEHDLVAHVHAAADGLHHKILHRKFPDAGNGFHLNGVTDLAVQSGSQTLRNVDFAGLQSRDFFGIVGHILIQQPEFLCQTNHHPYICILRITKGSTDSGNGLSGLNRFDRGVVSDRIQQLCQLIAVFDFQRQIGHMDHVLSAFNAVNAVVLQAEDGSKGHGNDHHQNDDADKRASFVANIGTQ